MAASAIDKQRAADAIADGVHLVLAGRLLDGVERGERPLAHVFFQALLREARVGIDPGDAEDGEPLVDAPLDEGFFRREIEHVEFVDPGRHDQQRPLEHRRGRRRILDELHELVLEDHLAGRGGEIAPDREHRGIRLADLQVAAAGLDVLGEHMHAAHQIVGVAGERFAQQFGIGQHEIRRRQRVGDLPHVELGFLLGVRIEVGGVADQLVGPARGEQISLLEEIEELVRGPLRIGEALVVGRGRGDRRRRFAGEPLGRRCPQIEVGFAEPGLQLQAALRIGQPIFRDLPQRLGHFGHLLGGVRRRCGLPRGA